jgi:hypothetical protein
MNPREIVNHIRSGPAELVLDNRLRFRRRTRSNPCDFIEFIGALQSSETIRTVNCYSQFMLMITEEEWVLLVKTLGSIKDIEGLRLRCRPGSRDFHPFQAVADVVNNAQSLRKLEIHVETLITDPLGLNPLGNALRKHTGLRSFMWCDFFGPWLQGTAPHEATTDLLLQVLPACSHLRQITIITKYASVDAMKSLLHQCRRTTNLRLFLKTEHWLAVADEIRHGRCNVQKLTLGMFALFEGARSEATEAVQAVANAIRLDHNVEELSLQMENGFTDDAAVALAEALNVNNTLCLLHLVAKSVFTPGINQILFIDTLGSPAYDAFSVMLRVNTSLVLKLRPAPDTAIHRDERLCESRRQMRIEQRLNFVGRGRLLSASRQTTREDWIDALYELSSNNINDSGAFKVSCLYNLLQLNPSICLLKDNGGTSNSGD